jgi:peptidyl-prolyl cis-trans isomerase C
MKFEKILTYYLGLVVLAPQCLLAQTESEAAIDKDDPQQVFAYQGDAILTQTAFDAAISRIPENSRMAFVRDGSKIETLTKNLLQAEVVAVDADKNGFSSDPLVQARMRQAARKELALAWVEEQARRVPAADYAAMAHEDYLAHPEKYMTDVMLDVSHILIGTEERSAEEALALAQELKARLSADPELFDALVKEYSDDPSAESNSGRFRKIRHGQMVKPFETAAYALSTPGQISDPVETEFGYHLIRLDRRYESEVIPFEEVRERAEEQMRAKHIDSYRTAFLRKLLQEPIVVPEGALEIMAKRYFGENLENAPVFTEDGIE